MERNNALPIFIALTAQATITIIACIIDTVVDLKTNQEIHIASQDGAHPNNGRLSNIMYIEAI